MVCIVFDELQHTCRISQCALVLFVKLMHRWVEKIVCLYTLSVIIIICMCCLLRVRYLGIVIMMLISFRIVMVILTKRVIILA